MHYWLTTHLPYRCRHAGACCTARWPIPIEHDRAAAVQAAIDDGRVAAPLEWRRHGPDTPADAAGVLALQPSGACVFHHPRTGEAPGAGGCAIHPWRPRSCEHFPYVCVIDPRGVHVTLSHFCPTAAALLFDDEDVRIVSGPVVLGDDGLPEGLDARDALPPAASATRLLSWDEVTAFEAALVARLASDAGTPAAPSIDMFELARAAVLPGWSWPAAPSELDAEWRRRVAPEWPRWARVIGRYLSAKAHASWAMHLGDGPRAVERIVDLARTVLQVEAARACLARGGRLDRPALTHAIRQSDLLLAHLADPGVLATAGD